MTGRKIFSSFNKVNMWLLRKFKLFTQGAHMYKKYFYMDNLHKISVFQSSSLDKRTLYHLLKRIILMELLKNSAKIQKWKRFCWNRFSILERVLAWIHLSRLKIFTCRRYHLARRRFWQTQWNYKDLRQRQFTRKRYKICTKKDKFL